MLQRTVYGAGVTGDPEDGSTCYMVPVGRGVQREYQDLLDMHRQVRGGPPHFYDVTFPLPPELISGKETVTVRFQADDDSQIPAIFGVRIVRANGI